MKIDTYRGYELHRPTSGGKAGKGCNKTSTIQVRQNGCIVKQCRWSVNIFMDKERAIARAKAWVDAQLAPAAEKWEADQQPGERGRLRRVMKSKPYVTEVGAKTPTSIPTPPREAWPDFPPAQKPSIQSAYRTVLWFHREVNNGVRIIVEGRDQASVDAYAKMITGI